eukprot:gene1524-1862_t
MKESASTCSRCTFRRRDQGAAAFDLVMLVFIYGFIPVRLRCLLIVRKLLQTAVIMTLPLVHTQSAFANPLEDVARQLTRPSDITPLDAAVALLDARSTLRDMQPLVASALDSKDRFDGRKLWPAYAKWLRPVGPSAPVAAALIGGTDTEATLSAEYGGTGSLTSSPVDAVYISLGRVLTISGRTIRDEAQVSVKLIKDAESAIDDVITKLPKDLVQTAQQFRAARAASKA